VDDFSCPACGLVLRDRVAEPCPRCLRGSRRVRLFRDGGDLEHSIARARDAAAQARINMRTASDHARERTGELIELSRVRIDRTHALLRGDGRSAPAHAFDIERRQAPGAIRIVVRGEVDIATAPHLRAAVAGASRDGHLVVLDLAGVTFMDSAGLHALVGAHATHRDRLRIIVGAPAARVLDASGLRSRLPVIGG
jgi:anti-anti-sigma factor